MMEITIQLPPQFFNNNQTITLIKEDPQSVEDHFQYHRQSKPENI